MASSVRFLNSSCYSLSSTVKVTNFLSGAGCSCRRHHPLVMQQCWLQTRVHEDANSVGEAATWRQEDMIEPFELEIGLKIQPLQHNRFTLHSVVRSPYSITAPFSDHSSDPWTNGPNLTANEMRGLFRSQIGPQILSASPRSDSMRRSGPSIPKRTVRPIEKANRFCNPLPLTIYPVPPVRLRWLVSSRGVIGLIFVILRFILRRRLVVYM